MLKDVPIDEFRFLYKVSDTGQIWSNKRNIYLKNHIRNGYCSISLYNGNLNIKKTFDIHNLVAIAFIGPRPSLGYIINHKNGIKIDNRVDNLEWITYSGNTKHALDNGLIKPHYKSVSQYDLNNNLIAIYNSIEEASKSTGANAKHIPSVCRGLRNTCGGYIWRYTNEEKDGINNDNEEKIYIPDFPNYAVTKSGKIFSNSYRSYLKPKVLEDGYCTVKLSNKNIKKDFYIHYLVALVLIPNPDNKPYVNHKNGNKSDNSLENLEWVTHKENMHHANQFIKFNHGKSIIQMSLNGEFIKQYDNIRQASIENNIDASSIVKSCKNKVKSAGGYIWIYDKSN